MQQGVIQKYKNSTFEKLNTIKQQYKTLPLCKTTIMKAGSSKGVFKTQSKTYDGGFLPKYLTAFNRSLFSKKSSVLDVRPCSECESDLTHLYKTFSKNLSKV